MFTRTKKLGYGLALAAVTLGIFGLNTTASAMQLTSPPQPLGNQASIFFPIGATFSLSGRTNISTVDKANPLAASQAGTVYLDPLGAGVQNALKMGSKGIQGGPTDGIEELDINYNVPVSLNSITIDLAALNLGKGLGFADDPFLIIQHASNPNQFDIYNETNWGAAFTMTGPSTGTLNLANLGLSNFAVSSVRIRETHEFLFVAGATGTPIAVPEPMTWLTMTGGLLLVAFVKRRKELLRRQG